MLNIRVIPVLLLRNNGLVKGVQYRNHKYVGDPINAVKIFNEKEVDELVFLDISATLNKKGPNFELIKDIASEAFMPFAYGGGITELKDIEKLFNIGVEKVILNSIAYKNPEIISEAAKIYGNQSIVVSIDIKKTAFNQQRIFTHNGSKRIKVNLVDYIKNAEQLGAGELIINSIDRDGTMNGYDIELIKKISELVSIPVVACGGAGNMNDFKLAVKQANASAVAAGSMFVFNGPHRAVLISYPNYDDLVNLLKDWHERK